VDVTGNGNISPYQYDGLGNRVAQTVDDATTQYLLDLLAPLPEVIAATQGASSTRYVQVGGQVLAQREASTWQYVLPDHLGSVRQLSGSAGGGYPPAELPALWGAAGAHWYGQQPLRMRKEQALYADMGSRMKTLVGVAGAKADEDTHWWKLATRPAFGSPQRNGECRITECLCTQPSPYGRVLPGGNAMISTGRTRHYS
jgi:YD repeat-containing protein